MQLSKSHFSLLLALIISSYSWSQSLSYSAVGRATSLGFETDYHCLGINSSALGWGTGYEGKRFATGSMEFFGQIQSDSLNKDKFDKMYKLFRSQIGDKKYSTETQTSLMNAAQMYSQAGVYAQLNMSYLSFSFQNEKFGGIAFSIIDNYAYQAKLNVKNASFYFENQWQDYVDSAYIHYNGDTSRIAFHPELSEDTLAAIYSIHLKDPINFNEFTKGSKVKMAWNRNYNFGYGRKIIGKDSLFILYGGIGARFIQSVAQMDFTSDNDGAFLRSSLPNVAEVDRSGVTSQVNPFNFSAAGGFFPKPVGQGFGLDLSASALLFKKFRAVFAINNIGSVTYAQKVYKGNDLIPQEISVDGLDPAMIQQSIKNLIRTDQLMTYQGEMKFSLANASDVRVGGSFAPVKQINVGFEFIAPLNKENVLSLQNPVLALGADFRPFPWISITAGYWGGGVYQGQIPLGLSFIAGGGSYEFGVSSRDMLRFLGNNSTSVSLAMGFARVRF